MNRLIGIVGALLLIAGLGFAGTLRGAEAPEREETPPTTAEKPEPGAGDAGETTPPAQPPAGKDTSQAPAEGGGPGDVFVPSEDISEDFAVSFPVDI